MITEASPQRFACFLLKKHHQTKVRNFALTIEIEPKPAEQPRRRGRRPYRHNPLNRGQEIALIRRYALTFDSIGQIAKDFGVNSTYPYRVLDKNDIKWRRGSEETFADYIKGHPLYAEFAHDLASVAAAPEPEAVIELGPVIELGGVRPPEFPAHRDIPMLTAEMTPADLTRWEVRITEQFVVMGDSIEGALFAARELRPNAHISSIRILE